MFTECAAYCMWHVACLQVLRITISYRKCLPLCTFLDTRSLELGSLVGNSVHLLRIERLFAILFILGRKSPAVLDDNILQVARILAPPTEHHHMCLGQGQVLLCLHFYFILAFLTLGVFIGGCNHSEQRCTPTLGVTIVQWVVHILVNLV